MADYVVVPSSSRDPESPINSILINALYDNSNAIAEGASGAPRVLAAALNQVSGSEAMVTAAIRASAVTEPKLANNAVSSRTVEALAITNAKVANAAITEWKLANDSVSTIKLQSGAVDSGTILDGAVIAAKIGNNAVINDKLSNSSIKLSAKASKIIETASWYSVAAGASIVFGSGFYNVVGDSSMRLEIYVDSAWRQQIGGAVACFVCSDASDVRFINIGGSAVNVYYQKWE